jgi:hypothetical protein
MDIQKNCRIEGSSFDRLMKKKLYAFTLVPSGRRDSSQRG